MHRGLIDVSADAPKLARRLTKKVLPEAVPLLGALVLGPFMRVALDTGTAPRRAPLHAFILSTLNVVVGWMLLSLIAALMYGLAAAAAQSAADPSAVASSAPSLLARNATAAPIAVASTASGGEIAARRLADDVDGDDFTSNLRSARFLITVVCVWIFYGSVFLPATPPPSRQCSIRLYALHVISIWNGAAPWALGYALNEVRLHTWTAAVAHTRPRVNPHAPRPDTPTKPESFESNLRPRAECASTLGARRSRMTSSP
eukprot:4614423-Prymnesium_polylepis.2